MAFALTTIGEPVGSDRAIECGRGKSGGTWRRGSRWRGLRLSLKAAAEQPVPVPVGERRHVWHQALRASNGLAITFGPEYRKKGKLGVRKSSTEVTTERPRGAFHPFVSGPAATTVPGSGINFGGDSEDAHRPHPIHTKPQPLRRRHPPFRSPSRTTPIQHNQCVATLNKINQCLSIHHTVLSSTTPLRCKNQIFQGN